MIHVPARATFVRWESIVTVARSADGRHWYTESVTGPVQEHGRPSAQPCLCCSAHHPAARPQYAYIMAMVFARVSLPGWIVIMAMGVFLAPAGVVTTVLLAALGLACLPVITGGVWKRTSETLEIERRETAAIDTEFTVENTASGRP